MGLIYSPSPRGHFLMPSKSERSQTILIFKKDPFNVPLIVKEKVSSFPFSSKWWRCLYDLAVCKPSNFPK